MDSLSIVCKSKRFISFIHFRLYPVVIGNGRNLQSDAVISGFHVPKGVSQAVCLRHLFEFQFNWLNNQFFPFQTHVIFPHLAVSHSAEYFPDPEQFLPERWIKRGELSKFQYSKEVNKKQTENAGRSIDWKIVIL